MPYAHYSFANDAASKEGDWLSKGFRRKLDCKHSILPNMMAMLTIEAEEVHMTVNVFTPARAGKYLKALQEEKDRRILDEKNCCTYTLTVGEEADPPEYDYEETRQGIADLDDAARAVRHALHVFNATEVLPECGMTIDEALILLAQLNAEKSRLGTMRSRQPKERVSGSFYRNETVEYCYANYDLDKVCEDYVTLSARISKIQLELDLCNHTKTFEVDL